MKRSMKQCQKVFKSLKIYSKNLTDTNMEKKASKSGNVNICESQLDIPHVCSPLFESNNRFI